MEAVRKSNMKPAERRLYQKFCELEPDVGGGGGDIPLNVHFYATSWLLLAFIVCGSLYYVISSASIWGRSLSIYWLVDLFFQLVVYYGESYLCMHYLFPLLSIIVF